MESLLDFMQDSAPVSAPTAKPEQEQEKEFTVSEISAEIKRFVETNSAASASVEKFSAANELIPGIGIYP